jgi:hypothetical protein
VRIRAYTPSNQPAAANLTCSNGARQGPNPPFPAVSTITACNSSQQPRGLPPVSTCRRTSMLFAALMRWIFRSRPMLAGSVRSALVDTFRSARLVRSPISSGSSSSLRPHAGWVHGRVRNQPPLPRTSPSRQALSSADLPNLFGDHPPPLPPRHRCLLAYHACAAVPVQPRLLPAFHAGPLAASSSQRPLIKRLRPPVVLQVQRLHL